MLTVAALIISRFRVFFCGENIQELMRLLWNFPQQFLDPSGSICRPATVCCLLSACVRRQQAPYIGLQENDDSAWVIN